MELLQPLSVVLLFYLTGTIAVNPQSGVFVNGDLIIGGLVPVHLSPDFAPHPGAATCKGDFHLRGYRGVEAMLFALELINNDTNLLPNISLGADIKDTCGSVDYAIMECLNFDFIKSVFTESDNNYCSKTRDNSSVFNSSRNSLVGSNNSECCTRNKRTVAVVGAAFSGVTMAAAGLAGLFRIPVVSFSSTSRLLSDRARFSYFYRTVPSDELQAQAIVDILHYLEWRYVITVASDNEYGRSGISALKQIIQNASNKKHVCIVVDELFSRRKDDSNEIGGIFHKIKQFPKVKVIVLYVEFPDAKYFLKKAKSAGLNDYMFIASDSWAGSMDAVEGAGNVISTVIGLRPPSPKVLNFNEYFYKKLRDGRRPHTWTKECNDSLTCSGDMETECYTGIHQNGYVSYVIDAVFTIAHALHSMLHCSESACAKDWRAVELRKLLAGFIQNVTFRGISNKSIRFDPYGGANGLYDIHQFTGHEYEHVGHWDEDGKPALQIRNLSSLNGSLNGLPTSICSKECDKGEYKTPIPHFPDCCWKCAKCVGRTFANTSGLTSCTECPLKTWPTADHTDCQKIEARYLSWDEGWAVAITCISLIGCVAVLWTMVVLQRYQQTAVVRASSRQFCHVLLIGILLFYVTPLVYIAKPSMFSCKLLPFLFGMCLVLVVGTIMIKTNRISRIFNDKLFQKGRSSCLGNRWQIVWLVCLLTIEIVACFGWVYGTSVTPSPEEVYSNNSKDASLVCDFSGSKVGFSLWLIYNAGLIVVCTYQAFIVRKVPQNYNESKFIAFSMTTLCITVIVFVPSYMGTSGWYRAVISCFLFIFLGSATWGSIFIPKIYIIFFRPHKNVPMRPSVSSITLGVIMPSPAVVSNMSDMSRRSRSPSADSDQNFERADCNDTWESSSLKSRDVSTENEVRKEEARDRFARDHETSSERFEGETTEMPENMKNKRPYSCDTQEEKKEKKTSVVRFEDEVFVDDFSSVCKPILVEKLSDPQGILRSKMFGIGDDTIVDHAMENVSWRRASQSLSKRKSSSVRFSEVADEMPNKNQYHFVLALNNSPDEDENCIKKRGIETAEGAGHEGADDSSDANGAVNSHVNSSGTTNKRKMSVWCLDHKNEEQQVKQEMLSNL